MLYYIVQKTQNVELLRPLQMFVSSVTATTLILMNVAEIVRHLGATSSQYKQIQRPTMSCHAASTTSRAYM